jgi:hypothetical protein
LIQNSSKDRVTVASEKADFIADRISAGVAASEQEIRKLARDLREIATQMGPAWKKPRPIATHRPKSYADVRNG